MRIAVEFPSVVYREGPEAIARLGRAVERIGFDTPIAVMPEGPMTIPYVADRCSHMITNPGEQRNRCRSSPQTN